MSSDFNQDSENDIPDWLRGMEDGNDDAEFGSGDLFPSDSSDQEDVPEWLAGIRSTESNDEPTFMDEEVPDKDTDEWLESIRDKHQAETENLKKPRTDADDNDDYLEKIRKLKETEDSEGDDDDEEDPGWGSVGSDEEPQDEIAAAWASNTGELDSTDDDEEDLPDWLSGLPSLDPVKDSPVRRQEPAENEDENDEWLQTIRQQNRGADEGLSGEKEEETPAEEEDDSELPHVSPLSDPPPDTGSLPTWLENLQTAGLVLPEDLRDEDEEIDEGFVESFDYRDEDVSSLLSEADDLPDWIGEDVEESEEEEEEEPEIQRLPPSIPQETETFTESEFEEDDGEDVEIEKAELPTWLQAMRPVEAVTSAADLGDEDDETTHREQEKVGPLSGLSDVLPAEPHVVHFGSQATPTPSFTLSDVQKRYSKLLLSMVEGETKSPPAEKRSVALPQQILRWVIAVVLVLVVVFVLWFRVDLFGMPAAGIPPENAAVINTVNTLTPGQRVLVAFEYQPALSGEMESVSAAIINHLLSKQVELVLFSSQPTGPGLAEAFLQQEYLVSDYLRNHQYVNLGYLSGGSAALLNFANDPRRAMPLQDASGANRWDQAPLSGISTLKDFAMVLVITDDPDMARSWVEQVQPILDPSSDGGGTPLVMAVSAQAEPLVYPYYLTSPRQVTGYVSGLSGGAFYESQNGVRIVANQYWNAYNVGLLLTVLIIALGVVFNLARQTFVNTGREKA
ncbi:MAG TPA: hypothetical protein VJ965_08095 [Anaerolineales bacterium]|nr:hypothetical protein [Anaerolineales bacterium]